MLSRSASNTRSLRSSPTLSLYSELPRRARMTRGGSRVSTCAAGPRNRKNWVPDGAQLKAIAVWGHDDVVAQKAPMSWRERPGIWTGSWPRPRIRGALASRRHKYSLWCSVAREWLWIVGCFLYAVARSLMGGPSGRAFPERAATVRVAEVLRGETHRERPVHLRRFTSPNLRNRIRLLSREAGPVRAGLLALAHSAEGVRKGTLVSRPHTPH